MSYDFPITPENKDKILNLILESGEPHFVPIESSFLADATGVEKIFVEIILNDFGKSGLINITSQSTDGLYFVNKTAKTYDFVRRGGFVVVEQTLLKESEKLTTELRLLSKQLGPQHLDTVEKIISIAGNITTVVSAFLPK